MHPLIAITLINQGVLKSGATELEGFYKGVGLSGRPTERVKGTFVLKTAKRLKTGEIFFECTDITDGSIKKIMCEDVTAIDGMVPNRAAEVAGFTVSGNEVVPLKKRGRKAKPDIAGDDFDDDDDEDLG
jgi:hypothetical protein